MASTRSELHKLTTAILLSIQQNRIGVNLKALTDKCNNGFIKMWHNKSEKQR